MDLINTIRDSFTSLTASVKTRVTSPFGGAYLSFWVIYNWRLVYYFLFEDGSASDKISYIDKFYFDSVMDMYLNPLFMTLGYMIIFPILSNGSSIIYTSIDRKGEEAKEKIIRNGSFITNEEKSTLYRLMNEQARAHSDEVKEYENKINALNKVVLDVGSIKDADRLLNYETEKNKNSYVALVQNAPDLRNQIASILTFEMGLDTGSTSESIRCEDMVNILFCLINAYPDVLHSEAIAKAANIMNRSQLGEYLRQMIDHNFVGTENSNRWYITENLIQKIYKKLNDEY